MSKQILLTNLTDKEIKICQAFVKLGTQSVSEAAKKAKIPRTTVYNFIGKLALKDLIRHKIINNIRYYYTNKEKMAVLSIPVESNDNENNFIFFNNLNMIKKAINESLKSKKKLFFG